MLPGLALAVHCTFTNNGLDSMCPCPGKPTIKVMPHARQRNGFMALWLTRVVAAGTLLIAVAGAGPAVADQDAVATDPLALQIAELGRNEDYLAAFSLAVERLERVLAATPDDTGALIDALAQAQLLAVRCGHWTLAEEVQRIIVDICRSTYGDHDLRLASALTRYGGIARITRGMPASWSALNEAQCILEDAGETESRVFADLLLAQSNWHRWKDRELAVENMTRALSIYEREGPTPSDDTAEIVLWLGWMHLHMGCHGIAVQYLDRAERELALLGLDETSSMGTLLSAKADLAAIAGDWARAEDLYKKATRCFELSRVKRGVTSRDTPLHGYNLLAVVQAKQGKYDAAWRSLERYRGQLSRAALALAPQGNVDEADQARLLVLSERLMASRASARALSESPHVSLDTWRALAKELRLTAEYARAETDYVLAHPIREPELEGLKGSLPGRTAYLGWLDARIGNDLGVSRGRILNSRWAYVVRPGSDIQLFPIWEFETDDEDKAVRMNPYMTLVQRASAWRQRVPDDPALRVVAAEMLPLTLGSALSALEDVDHLIVEFPSVDGWTQTDALVEADGRYLCERFAISLSPSAAVYTTLRERSLRSRNEGAPVVLAVGDPIFSADASYPTSGKVDQTLLRAALNRDPGALGQLPRLPSAARELNHIESLFLDCRVLSGADATEQSMGRLARAGELERFDIVHVASHALIDPAPDRCAIAFSRVGVDPGRPSNDGLLEAKEIRHGWRLDADLVVLSGCQTAGVDAWVRGEPMGFVQDLFAAGARCVMVSRWKVDDLATFMLMSRFYENLAWGRGGNTGGGRVTFAEALGEAKNWLREYEDEDGNRSFAHPVYWSSFILIGDAN